MMPMIPDPLSIDLGSQALRFGWTMDGSVLVLLAVLLVPWVLMGLAAVSELLDTGRAESAVAGPAPFRQAA
jgi:hypothetical protein